MGHLTKEERQDRRKLRTYRKDWSRFFTRKEFYRLNNLEYKDIMGF